MTKEQKIEEILNRGVANVIPNRGELKKELLSGKTLNIYLGIDPTSTHLHLGHAVPLRKLQSLVELGHNVTFLIGDFTALIGDNSDKESERPILTKQQIRDNFKTYQAQAEKFVDFTKVKVRYNSEWLCKLGYEDVIKIFQHFSLNDFISRELIRKRLDNGTHIRFDEMAYPAMQGYDSYYMDTDLQIGGTDQTFNMQAGRILQKDLRGKESFVLTNTFLEGTDGRKMSKSWDNAIWLEDPPEEIYGKVMSLKDELLSSYLALGTGLNPEAVTEKNGRLKNGENPMIIKKELAFEIVKELNNEATAKKAQAEFEETFQKKGLPADLPAYTIKKNNKCTLIDILVDSGAVSSRSEAKRLLQNKSVEINGAVVDDPKFDMAAAPDAVLKIGKTRFLKVVRCD